MVKKNYAKVYKICKNAFFLLKFKELDRYEFCLP